MTSAPTHKIIKLTCGDIVIGIVEEALVIGGNRIMKQPWEYVNLGTTASPQLILAPYQMFLFGEHKEVKNLELQKSQIVYEKNLSDIPNLKDQYFERAMNKSGIAI